MSSSREDKVRSDKAEVITVTTNLIVLFDSHTLQQREFVILHQVDH